MGLTVMVTLGYCSLKAAIRESQLEASVKPPMLKAHRLISVALLEVVPDEEAPPLD